MFTEYTNSENTRIVLTIEELRTFVKDFANAEKSEKVAIVHGVDNLGGEYVGIERVKN